MIDAPPTQSPAKSSLRKTRIKVTLYLALVTGTAVVCGPFLLRSPHDVTGPVRSAMTGRPAAATPEPTTVKETDPTGAGATERAKAAALVYLDELRADHLHSAYGRQCAKLHARFSESDYIAIQAAQQFGRRIHSYTVVKTDLMQRDGSTAADVTLRVTDPVNPRPFTLHLVVEAGEWKVCE
ncbi:hypothetical protein AB0B66_32225 [Catellatospora sp. NPDC049111]|uniref:hypothetical protein n=1 Tax=Catellatospora sp. NPDC049111 TaxID=3155271 RepID=UPI0033CA99B8